LRKNIMLKWARCIKIKPSRLVLSVVFQLCRLFFSYGRLLFLSFCEAEVSPDLVHLFRLSSARYHLRLIKEVFSSLLWICFFDYI
jgi:hypothetical protein